MPAFLDPKLEAFAQALLLNLAHGMAPSRAADEAAKTAGYGGSSRAPNARKRAQRLDVKARMVELAAPQQEAREDEIAQDCDAVRKRLYGIVAVPIEPEKVKVADQIGAANLLARMEGWMAPERREHSGPNGAPIAIVSDAERVQALQQFIARQAKP